MSILGKLLGTDQMKEGIKKSSELAQTGARSSSDIIRSNLANSLAQYEPLQTAGNSALSQYVSLLNGTSNLNDMMANDVNYQNSLKQGLQAVQNSAAVGGALRSGATQKALYNQGQSYANQYLQNRMSNLYNLAMQGQQANSNVANLYTNSGNNLAGIQSNLYNTLGQNEIALGNIRGQEAAATTKLLAGAVTGYLSGSLAGATGNDLFKTTLLGSATGGDIGSISKILGNG